MKWEHFGPACDVRAASIRFYHWNIWLYSGDFAHVLALLLCCGALLRDRRTEGVSFKTQVLYLVIFTTRYLNVFYCAQWMYLLVMKATMWVSTLLIVSLLASGGASRDRRDTCSVRLLLLPALVLTGLIAEGDSVVEVLGVFSQHLEGFAMLPQYIYCYRDGRSRPRRFRGPVALSVLLLGAYRVLFGLNLLYKSAFAHVQPSSALSSLLDVVFFLDFLAFKLRGVSPLARATLKVDDRLRQAELRAVASVPDFGFGFGRGKAKGGKSAGAGSFSSAAGGPSALRLGLPQERPLEMERWRQSGEAAGGADEAPPPTSVLP